MARAAVTDPGIASRRLRARASRTGVRFGRVVAVLLLALACTGVRAQEARTPQSAFEAFVAARRAGTEPERDAALHALVGQAPRGLSALLAAHLAPAASPAEALAALDALARAGAAADVALVARSVRAGLQAECEHALVGIAARDERALDLLAPLVREIAAESRPVVVRAVARVGTVAAARWLAHCVERLPDLRAESLPRLGRLVQRLDVPAPDEAYAVVRGVLAGADTEALPAAIVAAGRMEDADAIPHLTALLREDAPGLRRDAVWALERISGLRLGPDPNRWDEWYALEQRWWSADADDAFAAIQDGDRAAQVTALLAIGKLHARRHRLAEGVAPALADPEPEVARLAAQVLGRLGSKRVGPALIVALGRPEPEVVRDAWRALRALTRKDLPADPAAWRAVFASDRAE